jgi:NO-binding membrane sensor protein with MHYT domain
MRIHPAVPFLLGLALLATAGFLEMSYVDMLGFPDGATTEYDVAVARAVWVFDRFTVVVALWLVVLSFWSRRRHATRALLATVVIYAAAIALLQAVDRYYAATLPGPWADRGMAGGPS